MIFHQISSGGDRNFGYLVGCDGSKKGVAIDPSPDPLPCGEKAEALNLKIVSVINTHSHHDHSAGNSYFKEKYNAAIITHESISSGDILVKDGQTLSVGNLTFVFIHTPGHTDDSICVKVNQELLTGDTLFVGKVGGTYSNSAARKEFESLKKLMKLDDDIRIWPGHNFGIRPSSTIGQERKTNPFILRLNDFTEFIWLKDHWLEYKKEHNIL